MHRGAIALLQAEGRATLAAVSDTSQKVLAEIDCDSTRCFSDYRRMLDETTLDAVIIASPISLHFEMTLEVLRRGIPLLLEKPPFPLIQQLDQACALSGSERIAVCFQWICSGPAQLMKRWIAEGAIGEPEEIRIAGLWPRRNSYYHRSPWAGRMMHEGMPVFDGPATNAFAHLIHHAMFLAGGGDQEFYPPEEVWGEFYRARKMESYDFAAIRGRFADGLRFTASLGHCEVQTIPFCVEARGTLGWIRWDEDGSITSSGGKKQIYEMSQLHLIMDCYRDFIAFCCGEVSRPATRLSDTRGYVLATNAALISSGGIHTVDPSCVRRYDEDGDPGVVLERLAQVMVACRDEGLLPSEQGVPWARAGQAQATHGCTSLQLEDYLLRKRSLAA